jgi:hypothetical protein
MRYVSRFALAIPFALAACSDAPTGIASGDRAPSRPNAQISDAAHDASVTGFFFLAPIVAQPKSSMFGTFDPTQTVTVSICPLANATTSDAACAGAPATLEAVSIGTDVNGNHYHTNWRTELFAAGQYYRIFVERGTPGAITGRWGFADVYLSATGRDFREINRTEFTPLLDGRTLPIKFRIEEGASPVPVTGGNGGGTVGGSDTPDANGDGETTQEEIDAFCLKNPASPFCAFP